MGAVKVEDALENAQKLCTYSNAFIHLYETNTLTSGEEVIEISNTQLGMGNLHSAMTCSAAVMAAVIACVDLEEDNCGEQKFGGLVCSLGGVALQSGTSE